MLPGFNHNIRYKNRVFHVQTEDNGLKQPRLITQVFIDGHVLALEKSTYDDIISAAPDERTRDGRIRVKMQDQHKQLLKNLVKGHYDERIKLYLHGNRPVEVHHHPDIPRAVFEESVALPNAPSTFEALSQDIDAIIIEAPEEISPESLLDPEFLREISAAIEGETRNDPPPRPPTPIAHLASDLVASGAIPKDADFLASLDDEMKRQKPLDPDEKLPVPDPVSNEDQITVRPLPNSARPRGGRNTPDPTVSARRSTRREPPASDTLVDFGLPAALRETLSRPRGDPRKRDALLDMELRNSAAQLDPIVPRQAPRAQGQDQDQTMLELDAVALRKQIAEQRERLRQAAAAKEKPVDEKPEVVVVERSLDEVILSYLSDDPE